MPFTRTNWLRFLWEPIVKLWKRIVEWWRKRRS